MEDAATDMACREQASPQDAPRCIIIAYDRILIVNIYQIVDVTHYTAHDDAPLIVYESIAFSDLVGQALLLDERQGPSAVAGHGRRQDLADGLHGLKTWRRCIYLHIFI